jgi:hypothetical protein
MNLIFYIGFFMVNFFLSVLLMSMIDCYFKSKNYNFGDSQMIYCIMYSIGITFMYIGVLE